ncbi:MAG: hypothetical protein GX102_07670 [Porphyromonadaceae bacterium]|nr:hypothetical protein [Porphyromonadaceae bacterium]
MKKLKLTLSVVILTLIAFAGCKKNEPTEVNQPKITFTTEKKVGSEIILYIEAEEGDENDVWIDLNNNGKKEIGESPEMEKVPSKDAYYSEKAHIIESQTITIYGKITSLIANEIGMKTLDVTKNLFLKVIDIKNNKVKTLDVKNNRSLHTLNCSDNLFDATAISKIIADLPSSTGVGKVYFNNCPDKPTEEDVKAAEAKNWYIEPGATPPTAYGFKIYPEPEKYISFSVDKPHTVKEIENSPNIYAAAYYAGTVYGYDHEQNFYHITHGTGHYEKKGQSNQGKIYGMTCDYSTGTLYCITANYELGKVNLDNGAVTLIGDLEVENMITLACSLEGKLYGITLGDEGKFYSINKSTGKATLIGDTGVKTIFIQSMAFHHPSGILYWAHSENYTDNLYQVNPADASVTNLGAHGLEITGLYFPYDTN